MGHWTDFSSALVTVLQGVELESSAAFADIKTIPTVVFSGWPAATVVPTDNGAEYADITQNLRIYAFDVDLYYVIQQDTNGGYQAAFDVMLPLVDETLDAIDNSNDLGGLADILMPAPSVWGTVEGSPGTLLRARITVQAKILTSQNNG